MSVPAHPDDAASPPTPYRDAAPTYRAAGWVGVLPIPYGTKRLRKAGWTGHDGAWPSGADIHAWTDSTSADEGGGNIALRLPHDVVGIDVDAYGDKAGADTLAQAVSRWGELSATWMTTARDDGVSGIRLYRIPEGLRWPGQVGPGIETIHTGHRYAVVWPSIHPEGRTYRWYRPDGLVSTAPPTPDELPDLPDAWLAGLTGGEMAEPVHRADLTPAQYSGWIVTHGAGDPCRALAVVRDRLLAELASGTGHESLRRLMGLVRFAEQGHTGLLTALGEVRAAFLHETTRSDRPASTRRDPAEADKEWRRSLEGATSRVLGAPSAAEGVHPDPCLQPFAGLIASTAVHNPVDVQKPAPSPAVPAAATSEDEEASPVEPAPVEHTSWWPRDLSTVLSGDHAEPPPAALLRADKQALFYAGKVNGLIGESESGKTWVALLAVAQALEHGAYVLYLDFEDAAAGITGRLRALGVADAVLLEHLTYIDPSESLHTLAAADLHAVATAQPWAIVVVDGVNAVMSLLGLDLISNTDATRLAQQLLRPLARTGAAVIVIDHVAKQKEGRGPGAIGAQAKRAMITGCQLAVEVSAPFGRGQTGRLKLTVDKDRAGHVRGCAVGSKYVGTAVMQSNADSGDVVVVIEPPDNRPIAEKRTEFRPTGLMERVSRVMQTTEGELSGKQIEAAVSGKREYVRAAVECLVQDGYLTRRTGAYGAFLHRLVRPYVELSDLVDDSSAAGDGDA